MCEKLKIKDLYGKDYEIKNFEKFLRHINKYHAQGSSIHEENGFFFKVSSNYSLVRQVHVPDYGLRLEISNKF